VPIPVPVRSEGGYTCNVTALCNDVTLQVTDTIRNYELNFHPVPHGVQYPASVTRWGSQFFTGVRAMSLQLAVASFTYIHYALKKKEKRADGCDVSRCTSTPAQIVIVSSL
jgi:hypothetical protein